MRLAIFVFATVLAVALAAGREDLPGCMCPRIYDPQCASNGRTFSNKCEFDCYQKSTRSEATLRVLHRGECTESDGPFYYDDERLDIGDNVIENVVLV